MENSNKDRMVSTQLSDCKMIQSNAALHAAALFLKMWGNDCLQIGIHMRCSFQNNFWNAWQLKSWSWSCQIKIGRLDNCPSLSHPANLRIIASVGETVLALDAPMILCTIAIFSSYAYPEPYHPSHDTMNPASYSYKRSRIGWLQPCDIQANKPWPYCSWASNALHGHFTPARVSAVPTGNQLTSKGHENSTCGSSYSWVW